MIDYTDLIRIYAAGAVALTYLLWEWWCEAILWLWRHRGQ